MRTWKTSVVLAVLVVALAVAPVAFAKIESGVTDITIKVVEGQSFSVDGPEQIELTVRVGDTPGAPWELVGENKEGEFKLYYTTLLGKDDVRAIWAELRNHSDLPQGFSISLMATIDPNIAKGNPGTVTDAVELTTNDNNYSGVLIQDIGSCYTGSGDGEAAVVVKYEVSIGKVEEIEVGDYNATLVFVLGDDS
jgi:hypothetical protein